MVGNIRAVVQLKEQEVKVEVVLGKIGEHLENKLVQPILVVEVEVMDQMILLVRRVVLEL